MACIHVFFETRYILPPLALNSFLTLLLLLPNTGITEHAIIPSFDPGLCRGLLYWWVFHFFANIDFLFFSTESVFLVIMMPLASFRYCELCLLWGSPFWSVGSVLSTSQALETRTQFSCIRIPWIEKLRLSDLVANPGNQRHLLTPYTKLRQRS